MTCYSRLVAALALALLVPVAVTPLASAQPAPIDTAIDSLNCAVNSLDPTSPSLSELRDATTDLSTAVSAALAADSTYHHAAIARTERAVNCANGYCDDRGRVDLLLGLDTLRNGYAKSYAAAATVSRANAAYAQAIGGLPHAEATARAKLFDILSTDTRTEYDIHRLNGLIRTARAEQRADAAFYDRAVKAHAEANARTRVALDRALQKLRELNRSTPQLGETQRLLEDLSAQLARTDGRQ